MCVLLEMERSYYTRVSLHLESNMDCLIASTVSASCYVVKMTSCGLGGLLLHFCYSLRPSFVFLYVNLFGNQMCLWQGQAWHTDSSWRCGKFLSSVRLLAQAGHEGLIRKEVLVLWCFSVAADSSKVAVYAMQCLM